jgi:GNAT superfamily N-acetyltransferase
MTGAATARTFGGLDDLRAMQEVARAGRLAATPNAMWHPGDLAWWFGYPPDGIEEATTIWRDGGGRAIGWVNIDPHYGADMCVTPDDAGRHVEPEIVAFVEERTEGPVTLLSRDDDHVRIALLEARGYRAGAAKYQMFAQRLDGPIAAPAPPEGFRLLDELTEEWVAERAECHHRAFDPSRMTAERYHHLRRAADYDPTLDVAMVSPDGRLVAYVMVWADEGCGEAQFEPVGTRPAFWRRGLGGIVVREALRRAAARGLPRAAVNCSASDARNLAFYGSCGFTPVTAMRAYVLGR